MSCDGVLAQLQSPGCLRVGEALRDDTQDADLALREVIQGPMHRRVFWRPRRSHRTVVRGEVPRGESPGTQCRLSASVMRTVRSAPPSPGRKSIQEELHARMHRAAGICGVQELLLPVEETLVEKAGGGRAGYR
jgi:hypothetical protein